MSGGVIVSLLCKVSGGNDAWMAASGFLRAYHQLTPETFVLASLFRLKACRPAFYHVVPMTSSNVHVKIVRDCIGLRSSDASAASAHAFLSSL